MTPDPMKALIPPGEGERLPVLGTVNTVLLTQESTDGRLTLAFMDVPPGRGIPPHVHTREDEVFHILEGSVEFQMGESAVRAEPGATVFAPRGQPHSLTCVSETEARMLLIATPGGIEEMFRALSRLPEIEPDPEEIAAICGRQGITFLPPGERKD